MANRSEEEIISLLQDNLSSVRKIAGWTTEELGDKIGVTKQTISNLENKKTKMTRTQYIAIGTVLKYEVSSNRNAEVLAYVIGILLDSDKRFSDKERADIKKNFEMLAVASATGMRGRELREFSKTLGMIMTGTIAGLAGAALAGAASLPLAVASSSVWMGTILGTVGKKPKK